MHSPKRTERKKSTEDVGRRNASNAPERRLGKAGGMRISHLSIACEVGGILHAGSRSVMWVINARP
jgi:hypothetical protein